MQNYEVQSYKEEIINGYKVEVLLDECPDDPRNWDNLGKWVCAHKRYLLPNEIKFNFKDFDSWQEVKKALAKRFDYVLPLYMYDHSGLAFNLGGLSPYWPRPHVYFDAGQVGYVVFNKSDVRKWFLVKKVTKKIEERIANTLRGEVEDYQNFTSGTAYWARVSDPENGEYIDSCSGFDDIDEAFDAGRELAESLPAYVSQEVQQPELVTAC